MQTSLTMTPLIAGILLRGDGQGAGFWLILISLVAVALFLVVICRVIVGEWIERTRCRNWPTVPAVVDIASVAYCEPDSLLPPLKASSYNRYYKATLTYKYHYPEEQMGDYSRDFANKDDANSWANSYKGETVKVHVDPRDPRRSVLREEDL
ncbi:MAG: DUF3592 domain-containing protein [Terracidiphilus sp.]